MTLKSYFSKIRFTFKHTCSEYLWLTAIYSVVLFFVGIIMPLISNQNPTNSISVNFYWARDISIIYFTILTIVGSLTAISAASVFSYLDDTESTDFYLCQPTTRVQMFIGRYFGGLFTILIPSIVSTVIFTGIMKFSFIGGEIDTVSMWGYNGWLFVDKADSLKTIVKFDILAYVQPFLLSLLFMFIVYSVCVFAKTLAKGMITSTLVAGLIGLGPLVGMFLFTTSVNDLSSYRFERNDIFNIEALLHYFNPFMIFQNMNIMQEDMQSYKTTITWAIVGVVMVIASLIAVKLRRAENANKVIPFEKSCSVIKYAVTILGSLFGVTVSVLFYRYSNNLMGSMVLATMFSGFAANLLAEVMFNRSRKDIISKSKLAICFLVVLAVIITVVVVAARVPTLPLDDINKGGEVSYDLKAY